MKSIKRLFQIQAFVAALVVFCASAPVAQLAQAQNYSVSPARPATIESIRQVTEQKESSGPLGMIAGGLIGGGLGSLVGAGNGRTAATIVGAVGGGYVGNKMQKSQTHEVYDISVKYDDGTWGSIRQSAAPPFHVGERVLVTDRGLEMLR